MTTRRYFANAAPQRTLTGSMTSGQTTLTISGAFTGWPTQFPFFAGLDVGTLSFEIVSVTAIAGSIATIVRGQDGTTGISHAAGATLDQVVIRLDADEANAHTSSNSGVHGVAGSVVGTTDVQTLSGKTLTSPTINGGTQASPVVNTPTINTPTVNGGTASNATNTGDATHSALIGKATTAGGKTLSLVNSAGVEKASADDAGNLSMPGAITTGGLTTASNGVVGGVIMPRTYATGAARDAAITAPVSSMLVWLVNPGIFSGYNGTSWIQLRGNDALEVVNIPLSGTQATPGAGTATWVTIGTATVPPWASKARVTWGVSGYSDSSVSSLNVTCAIKIGSVSGVSIRIPGSTVTTPSLTVGTSELLTGLSTGPQSVTVSATYGSGSGVFNATVDTRVYASIDYLL
jgi:hypothetical protein